MGQVKVPVTPVNGSNPARELRFDAIVETGAFGLILPTVWKERVGPLPHAAVVEVETADQRILTAEVCGPVRIRVDGFGAIDGEVVFMDMEPSSDQSGQSRTLTDTHNSVGQCSSIASRCVGGGPVLRSV